MNIPSMVVLPFDPLQRSAEAERQVMRGDKRRYHRFRGAPYYGGIATADAAGCSFLCAYCWNYGRNENPAAFGKFFSPEEVAAHLLEIAWRRSYRLFRVTGSEPILGEASFHHLIQVIELIFKAEPRSTFVLETNGLMLGYKDDLVQRINFPRFLVRVAVKGVEPESFEKITGAGKEYFDYPLLALRTLEPRGVNAWPALMEDLFAKPQIEGLKKTLRERGIHSDLELESLERYPFVLENLKRRGIFLHGES
jgi:uncharacterized Fe-S cluster-containing radical SAM superfamily protein